MKNVIQESKYKRKYSFSEVIWVKEIISGTNLYKVPLETLSIYAGCL